jgi:hypothetical protein
MSKSSVIVYEGPSHLIDRSGNTPSGNIFVVLSGLRDPSTNRKTGPMIQTWILPVGEFPSVRTAAAYRVCGDCEMESACYVNRITLSGFYQRFNQLPRVDFMQLSARERDRLLGSAAIRLGAFGNPSAMPLELAEALIEGRNHTSYDAMWRTIDPAWARVSMASCSSAEDAIEAWSRGWRVFLTLPDDTKQARAEIVKVKAAGATGLMCRFYSSELQCYACRDCSGQVKEHRASVILNPLHGPRTRRVAYHRMRDQRSTLPIIQ